MPSVCLPCRKQGQWACGGGVWYDRLLGGLDCEGVVSKTQMLGIALMLPGIAGVLFILFTAVPWQVLVVIGAIAMMALGFMLLVEG